MYVGHQRWLPCKPMILLGWADRAGGRGDCGGSFVYKERGLRWTTWGAG